MEEVKNLLEKAFACDEAKRNMQAQVYYQAAIEILMDAVTDIKEDKKAKFVQHIKTYIEQAEKVNTRIENSRRCGIVISDIRINENDTGYGYDRLFGKYLTSSVKEILIEDPYLRKKHQLKNLVKFLELVVKNCEHCLYIRVKTSGDPENFNEQKSILDDIKSNLLEKNITLDIVYEPFHDRIIVLSNGYVIVSGRGLDLYKKSEKIFSLGLHDYSYRKCWKTDIRIMHNTDK